MRRRKNTLRLEGFDYSRPGSYFITIVAIERALLFSDVVDAQVVLRRPGVVVDAQWQAIPRRYPGVELDEYVIMPNHIHGILVLTGQSPRAVSIKQVVQGFKSATSLALNRMFDQPGGTWWQRSYHDRIIRDEQELQEKRTYILDNPRRWGLSTEVD